MHIMPLVLYQIQICLLQYDIAITVDLVFADNAVKLYLLSQLP